MGRGQVLLVIFRTRSASRALKDSGDALACIAEHACTSQAHPSTSAATRWGGSAKKRMGGIEPGPKTRHPNPSTRRQACYPQGKSGSALGMSLSQRQGGGPAIHGQGSPVPRAHRKLQRLRKRPQVAAHTLPLLSGSPSQQVF